MTGPVLFLDANVLFSAARSSGGRAATLVRLARAGHCELITSPHCREEARRNIRLKYPDSVEALEGLVEEIRIAPESGGEAYETGLASGLPPKDAPVLGAALQAGADMLVTGDSRHFGHLFGEEISGTGVTTPAGALDALLPTL